MASMNIGSRFLRSSRQCTLLARGVMDVLPGQTFHFCGRNLLPARLIFPRRRRSRAQQIHLASCKALIRLTKTQTVYVLLSRMLIPLILKYSHRTKSSTNTPVPMKAQLYIVNLANVKVRKICAIQHSKRTSPTNSHTTGEMKYSSLTSTPRTQTISLQCSLNSKPRKTVPLAE